MPKVFIIACEASGDLHGSHLAMEMLSRKPSIELRGVGGPLMERAGVKIIEDMTKISALGLGDVLRQYFRYREIFYRALREIESFKPDAIVMIDSPAFNLRLAKKIKKRFPVFYYISPQLWAWGGSRIHDVRKNVSKMLVILPFEKDMYEKAGIPVEFVGHPLLDHAHASAPREALRKRFEIRENQIAIGILPGSRKKEIERILPAMMQTISILRKKLPDAAFFLVQASNVPKETFRGILDQFPDVPLRKLENQDGLFKDAVTAMDFALVTSGTATLETGLLGTPFFLLYKASATTYLLGKMLVRVPFLGLVNLLAGKRVVPEFIQESMDPEVMAKEALALIENQSAREEMKREFALVRKKLGEPGADRRAAEAVLRSI